MELICPSCEARYQVPDASIGEKGRQVSCMSCGHSWHAFPPLVLGSSSAPPTTASPGIDWQSPPRPGRSSTIFAPTESDEPPLPPRAPEPPKVSDQSRSEQLAEIREMLAEVQSEERAAAALNPGNEDAGGAARGAHPRGAAGAGGAAAMPLGTGPVPSAESRAVREPVPAEDEDDGESDPLRRRMAMHDSDAQRRRTDVEKLRKRHDRRARRQKRARETGTGAFLTGFLLIVMVAAIMTAIYMLHPQIAARMPGLEPVLTEYVAAIDGFRAQVAEGFAAARDWIFRLIEG